MHHVGPARTAVVVWSCLGAAGYLFVGFLTIARYKRAKGVRGRGQVLQRVLGRNGFIAYLIATAVFVVGLVIMLAVGV